MRVLPAAVLAASLLAGVAAARPAAPLTVYAASSLTDVFPRIDLSPRYSFAGSDTLAAQIATGAPADVYAAASPRFPQQLYAEGLVQRPVVFTRNALVLIIPRSNPAGITSVFDLRRSGVKLIVGASSVPVGSYTRQILRNMGLSGVLSNVVSQEQDVRDVLAKVGLGEADAGFVYATDARVAGDKVSVIRLPAWAQPKLSYEIAVVSSSPNKAAAQAFVSRVLGKAGQAKLLAAGFLRP